MALATWYDLAVDVLILRLNPQDTLRSVIRGAAIHGVFVVLLLVLSIWSGLFWDPQPGQPQVGYKIGLVIAIVIFLINWVARARFAAVADERGRQIIEELKCGNLNSFLVALLLGLIILLLWQVLYRLVFLRSPLDVLAEFYKLLFASDFHRDIAVSLKEIVLGICLGGVTAAALVSLAYRFGPLNGAFQILFHASAIAPIALLPQILGFGRLAFDNWSVACVIVFSFHPLVRAFFALQHHGLIPRSLLSIDDALPYAGVAIVYGEAMNATAGLGFSMVVAGATFQTDRGLAHFFALLFLVAVLSVVLRWLAKVSFRHKVTRDGDGPGDAWSI